MKGVQAELLEIRQRLSELTLKLTSQERETIKPFHSPIEVKTLNCPPNSPSHPSTHLLPSKSLSIVNTGVHKRDRRYSNKTRYVYSAHSGKKKKTYVPVSIEDIEQAIKEVETKKIQEQHRYETRSQVKRLRKRNRRIFDSGNPL